jgi:hypothetical protein
MRVRAACPPNLETSLMSITPRSGALCALAAAAAIVALPGCGGGSKGSTGSTATTAGGQLATYKVGFLQAASVFKSAAETASAQALAAKDTPTKLKSIEALRAAVSKAADDFAKLSPPANIKADHDRLVAELRQFASDVDAIRSAAEARDTTAATAAGKRVQQDQTQLRTTLASISAKLK